MTFYSFPLYNQHRVRDQKRYWKEPYNLQGIFISRNPAFLNTQINQKGFVKAWKIDFSANLFVPFSFFRLSRWKKFAFSVRTLFLFSHTVLQIGAVLISCPSIGLRRPFCPRKGQSVCFFPKKDYFWSASPEPFVQICYFCRFCLIFSSFAAWALPTRIRHNMTYGRFLKTRKPKEYKPFYSYPILFCL